METKDTISIAHHFGLPLYDLARFDTSTIPSHLLQNPIFQRHGALPLFTIDENCYVAITDLTLPDLNEITFTTGLKTTFVIVDSNQLEKAIIARTTRENRALFGGVLAFMSN